MAKDLEAAVVRALNALESIIKRDPSQSLSAAKVCLKEAEEEERLPFKLRYLDLATHILDNSVDNPECLDYDYVKRKSMIRAYKKLKKLKSKLDLPTTHEKNRIRELQPSFLELIAHYMTSILSFLHPYYIRNYIKNSYT